MWNHNICSRILKNSILAYWKRLMLTFCSVINQQITICICLNNFEILFINDIFLCTKTEKSLNSWFKQFFNLTNNWSNDK